MCQVFVQKPPTHAPKLGASARLSWQQAELPAAPGGALRGASWGAASPSWGHSAGTAPCTQRCCCAEGGRGTCGSGARGGVMPVFNSPVAQRECAGVSQQPEPMGAR